MNRNYINQYVCTETEPIVETVCGKVRGYISNYTYSFRGIRYAIAERFRMPKRLKSWDDITDCREPIDEGGIYNALDYGPIAPSPFAFSDDLKPWGNFILPHQFWMENEACQYLNIWTQGLESNAKRPVMVWLHGGGFFAGSGTDLYAYNGEELSRLGNCVVVTLNHRLNMLGFLNLSAYGPEYDDSANVGMADIVEALNWVHENIAQFGGDPGNVTIFGQSGGGGKVLALMQIPAADGLYHKAIVQSGVINIGATKIDAGSSAEKAEAIVRKLGLTRKDIHNIDTLPYRELEDAANAVEKETTGAPFSVEWAPVPGTYYIGSPVEVGFRVETSHIPLIVGSNLCEFDTGAIGDKKKWTDEKIYNEIKKHYSPDDAKLVKTAFEKAYPEVSSAYAANVDGFFRELALALLDRRKKDAVAPAYNYIFTFESSHKGGMMIGHSSEIPFVFHNAGYLNSLCKPGITERLQNEMSLAWTQFAKTGNPNHDGLVEWPEYTKEDAACMAFGDITNVKKNHFDQELLELKEKGHHSGNKV